MVIKIFIVMLLARLLAQLWLSYLNRKSVLAHADSIPEPFVGIIDRETYDKSVAYTLAKNRFGRITLVYNALILGIVIVSGFLPWFYELMTGAMGGSIWVNGLYIFAVGVIISIPDIPFEWWAQFRLEERFGFNKSTLKLWITDQLKGLAISFAIGFPLICLILSLVGWIGPSWWFWAFIIVFAFELIMMVLYPRLILPLFNKLEPLPEGDLRERLMNLADRTGFKAKTIQVMDGSKRSSHSNAFFTGFGRFRRIVLFDTLIEQLTQPQLEAVLAHEIGHYKKGHIPKTLAIGALMGLFGFWLLAYLAESDWFYAGFGFETDSLAPAFLLFGLLSGLVTFWFSPLFNMLSRKHEYEADAFALKAMGTTQPVLEALRKLSQKNLSNLTPHPIFSRFYYSHPTLLERSQAIERA